MFNSKGSFNPRNPTGLPFVRFPVRGIFDDDGEQPSQDKYAFLKQLTLATLPALVASVAPVIVHHIMSPKDSAAPSPPSPTPPDLGKTDEKLVK